MTDKHKSELAKRGVWLAFEKPHCGKVIAWAETARELGKICGEKPREIIYSNRTSVCGKYKYFETEEEALEYLEKGLHYQFALLHEPTGNRWASIKEAAEWFNVEHSTLTSAVYCRRLTNFKMSPGNPVIKEPNLKIVLVGPNAGKMADAWPGMPNGEWEKLKDLPTTKEKRIRKHQRKSWTWNESLSKSYLGTKVKVTDTTDYLKSRKIGEVGTLISKYSEGLHPYKVLFEDSSVIYVRPDQIEFLNQTR